MAVCSEKILNEQNSFNAELAHTTCMRDAETHLSGCKLELLGDLRVIKDTTSEDPHMRRLLRNSSCYAGVILSVALTSSLVLAQNPATAQGPINNPKEDMVIPKPPSEGAIGQPNAKDIPGAGAQTTPSTVSAANAEKDKHPWLDRGVGLTVDQKKAIYSSLSTKLDTDGASKFKIYGIVSEVLPGDFSAQALPADLATKLPSISDLKYVKTNNQVLLVNPGNNTVAAVIAQ